VSDFPSELTNSPATKSDARQVDALLYAGIAVVCGCCRGAPERMVRASTTASSESWRKRPVPGSRDRCGGSVRIIASATVLAPTAPTSRTRPKPGCGARRTSRLTPFPAVPLAPSRSSRSAPSAKLKRSA
jgi:hypothetical protein